MSLATSKDEKFSDGTNGIPSESDRLRVFPSDLLEKFGVHSAQLSSLGTEDTAKLVDALHPVGFILASGIRKLIDALPPAFERLPSRLR